MTTDYDRSAAAARILKRPTRSEDSPTGVDAQPISTVQWVDRDEIRANRYNPNFVAPPELRLLRTSLLEDGWTTSLVVHELPKDEQKNGYRFELVDGEHRWHVASDKRVAALTGGKVPVVVLRPVAEDHRIASTVRHNRARGTHHVIKMADIVGELYEKGVKIDRIGELLGMEEEEITRFLDRGNMVKRGASEEFSKGWQPA